MSNILILFVLILFGLVIIVGLIMSIRSYILNLKNNKNINCNCNCMVDIFNKIDLDKLKKVGIDLNHGRIVIKIDSKELMEITKT